MTGHRVLIEASLTSQSDGGLRGLFWMDIGASRTSSTPLTNRAGPSLSEPTSSACVKVVSPADALLLFSASTTTSLRSTQPQA